VLTSGATVRRTASAALTTFPFSEDRRYGNAGSKQLTMRKYQPVFAHLFGNAFMNFLASRYPPVIEHSRFSESIVRDLPSSSLKEALRQKPHNDAHSPTASPQGGPSHCNPYEINKTGTGLDQLCTA
jgi:hypothetical protein